MTGLVTRESAQRRQIASIGRMRVHFLQTFHRLPALVLARRTSIQPSVLQKTPEIRRGGPYARRGKTAPCPQEAALRSVQQTLEKIVEAFGVNVVGEPAETAGSCARSARREHVTLAHVARPR